MENSFSIPQDDAPKGKDGGLTREQLSALGGDAPTVKPKKAKKEKEEED